MKLEASVDVGGRIETEEGTKATKVEIGRNGKIIGVVVAKDVLLGEKAEVEDIYAESLVMEEQSTARNVYTKRVHLERGCRIIGELQYTEELKREQEVTLAKEPVKAAHLPTPPI